MDKMKNNKFIYNLKGIGRMLTPSFLLPKNREKILRDLDSRKDLDYIKKRVDYYCPMSAKITLDGCAKSLDFLRWTRKQTVYFFDCYKYARYFPQNFKAHFEFGDVYYIPQKPSFAKSRPILDYFIQSSLRGSGNATTKQSTAESPLQESQSDRSNPNLPRHCEEAKRPKQSTNPKIDCHDFATQNLAMTSWVDSSLRESRSDSWQSAKNINGGGQNDLNGADSSADSPQSPPFANSTLLNMEKIRHFTFIDDPFSFESKQNKLFYRGAIYQAHRTRFFEKYFGNPLCDLGHTGSKNIHQSWQKPKISIAKHLPYKFLLSLEGNDVASNCLLYTSPSPRD